MGLVGNILGSIGRKIRVAPSTKQEEKPGKRKKGKRRKKAKLQSQEGSKEVDLDAIKLGDPSPLAQIERQVIEDHKEVMRLEFEQRVQKAIGQVESEWTGFCEQCGAKAKYKETYDGHAISSFGKIFITYRRYWCPVCKKGLFPALRDLGIVPKSWTPYVAGLFVMLGVLVPFVPAKNLAKYFWNLDVSESGLWKLSKRTGEKLLAWEEKAAETYNNPHYDLQDKDGKAPEAIEMGIDGAMALCRGKKSEASSKSDCDEQDPIDPKAPPCGKEVKSAVIFKPQDRVQLSKDRCALLERTVVACRGSADVFFALLWASLAHYGLIGPETLVVIVADGAPWIWNRVSMFTNRVEILDFWHAAQHAWGCAKLLWEGCPVSIASWAKAMRKNIKEGKVAEIIEHLTELLENATEYKFSQKAIKELKKLIAYYTEHASRMDYPSYLSQGYSIGSGSVESVHKQLLHARMRLAGMRWSERGASRMVALRIRYLNNRWNEVESFLRAA